MKRSKTWPALLVGTALMLTSSSAVADCAPGWASVEGFCGRVTYDDAGAPAGIEYDLPTASVIGVRLRECSGGCPPCVPGPRPWVLGLAGAVGAVGGLGAAVFSVRSDYAPAAVSLALTSAALSTVAWELFGK